MSARDWTLAQSPLDAAAARWEAGRERFGPEWVGGEPLEELYEELLDAINYAKADARERVPSIEVDYAGVLALTAAENVRRELLRRQDERDAEQAYRDAITGKNPKAREQLIAGLRASQPK